MIEWTDRPFVYTFSGANNGFMFTGMQEVKVHQRLMTRQRRVKITRHPQPRRPPVEHIDQFGSWRAGRLPN